ncbi:MAG: hypothetical protein AVDCRST_MAG33-3448 [uncultured Thermomicrobiales bacterium]|uniref:Uncharacterized protein n=1 Tax=uncultured Thermomicrobiales bacterium TaxID=1645740 RepID=A0A6J4VJU7_9BACT|nr:MAG: hypothetical protein AVDCRST_MAG33-3448 [uncultured Thermomicrobiales bacterium]
MEVGVEVVEVLLVAGRPVEEDARVGLGQVDREADLLEVLLDDLLRLLADGVDRRLVLEFQPEAVLLANVAVHDPARVLEDLRGRLRIALVGRVLGLYGRDTGQDVPARALALTGRVVEPGRDQLTVDRQGDGLANGDVAEDRVRVLVPGALALGADRVRVGEVEGEALDRRSGDDAEDPLTALEGRLDDFRLDLDVPGMVPVTGLQHGLRGRGRLAAALEVQAGESRLVRIAEVRVGGVDDLVVRREVLEHERAGADGHHVHVVAGLNPVTRVDVAVGAVGERDVPVQVRAGVGDLDGQVVDRDALSDDAPDVEVDGVVLWVGDPLPGEDDVVGRERLAVRPGDALLQGEGDGGQVLGQLTVLERRDLGEQVRVERTVREEPHQRLVDDVGGDEVLGATGDVGVELSDGLPEQHLELAVLTAGLALHAGGGRLTGRDILRVRRVSAGGLDMADEPAQHRQADAEGGALGEELAAADLAAVELVDQRGEPGLILGLRHWKPFHDKRSTDRIGTTGQPSWPRAGTDRMMTGREPRDGGRRFHGSRPGLDER